jgi:hypothetical protein
MPKSRSGKIVRDCENGNGKRGEVIGSVTRECGDRAKVGRFSLGGEF